MSDYGVEIVTLSPGRYDDAKYVLSPELPCREPVNYMSYRYVAHDWELMSGPPDPIWWCRRCQRIEQRVLKKGPKTRESVEQFEARMREE